MPVHCDCGELTTSENGFRVCSTCGTRTKLKQPATPRQDYTGEMYADAVELCYECSKPIQRGKTYCPRHEAED